MGQVCLVFRFLKKAEVNIHVWQNQCSSTYVLLFLCLDSLKYTKVAVQGVTDG